MIFPERKIYFPPIFRDLPPHCESIRIEQAHSDTLLQSGVPAIMSTAPTLYSADDALTLNDRESTREAEGVLAQQLAALSVTKDNAQLDKKQRLIHFIDAKVGTKCTHAVARRCAAILKYVDRSLLILE